MQRTEADAGEVDRRIRRRNNALFVVYYAALPVAVVSLAAVTGLVVAGVAVAAAHVSVYVRAFEARQRLELLTDEPPEAVRDTFSAARNPLTSIWIAGADRIRDETETEVRFDRSWLLGSFSRQYTVSVTPDSEGGIGFEIRRGDASVVTGSVDVLEREGGTRLRTTTRRSPVNAFELLLVALGGSQIRRYLETCGYEVTDGRTAVGLRHSAGGGSDG